MDNTEYNSRFNIVTETSRGGREREFHIDKIFCNFFYNLSHQYDPYEYE